MRRRTIVAMLAATLLGVAACKSSTSADAGFSGRFVASSFNGAPLPIDVPSGFGPRRLLTSAELVVQTRGRVLDIRTIEEGTPASASYIKRIDSVSVPYVVENGRIVLTRRATVNTTVIDTAQMLSNEVLQVRVHYLDSPLDGQSGVLIYRRANP